ncbi:MAG TPA: putative C-S lyase [Bacteroidetes bacterium]|nr:putative C-S lyase [Bacteroidota bacterium]
MNKQDFDFDRLIDRRDTHSFKYDGLQKVLGTDEVIPMWIADMDFAVPPAVSKAIIKRAEHPIYGYTFRPDSYYESIVRWMDKRHGWNIEKEWIQYCPGVVPALNMAVQGFTEPGEGVILQSPIYHPFFHAINLNHRKLLNNQLKELEDGTYIIDFDDLVEKAKEARLLLLSNPHNPVGRSWDEDELRTLGEICTANNLLVVSDEIHADLTLPGHHHIPLASLSEEIASHTITCISPSKTFNLGGLNTSSVIISDPEVRKRFEEVIESLHLGMGNLFGMEASIAAYNHGEKWLDALLKYIQGNIDFARSFLKEKLPGIGMSPIEATYLLWLDFRKTGMNNDELHKFMINKAKVGSNDGTMYGPGGEGFQRLNVACPHSIVEEAFIRIYNAFSTISK